MFLTDKLIAAQREASREVAQGEVYSVELPIIGRVPVPSPRQLAIYAALGGLAAIELIDWPVAVAMGVGSALVSRQLGSLQAKEQELAETVEHELAEAHSARSPAKPATATTVRKAAPKKAPATKKAPAKKAAAKKTPPRRGS